MMRSRHRADRVQHRLPGAGPARSRAGDGADERLPDPDRHGDAGAAHGAALFQCAGSGAMAAEAPQGRLGELCGAVGDRYHALCQQYLGGKGGAVFTFGVKGGYAAGASLVNSVKLFSLLANIGDTRSLIIHPSSTTHRQLSEAEQIEAGAGAGRGARVGRHRAYRRHHRGYESGAGSDLKGAWLRPSALLVEQSATASTTVRAELVEALSFS